MMIDDLGAATLANGVLRIETLTKNSRGESVPTGEILIPATRAGPVAANLLAILKQLKGRLTEMKAGDQDAEAIETANGQG